MNFFRSRRDSPVSLFTEQVYKRLPASTDPLKTPHTPPFCLPVHLRDSSAASPSCSQSACVEIDAHCRALCSEWDAGGAEHGTGEELQRTVSTVDWPRPTTSCSQSDFLISQTPEETSGCSSPDLSAKSPCNRTQEEEAGEGDESRTFFTSGQDDACDFSGPFGVCIDEPFEVFPEEAAPARGLFPGGPFEAGLPPGGVMSLPDSELLRDCHFSSSVSNASAVSSSPSHGGGLLESLGVDSLEEDIALLYAASYGGESAARNEPVSPPCSALAFFFFPAVHTPQQDAPCFGQRGLSPKAAEAPQARRQGKTLRGLAEAAKLGTQLVRAALKIEENVLRRLCSHSSSSSGCSCYGSVTDAMISSQSSTSSAGSAAGETGAERGPLSAPLWGPFGWSWRRSQRRVCWGEWLGTFSLTLVLFASALSNSPSLQGEEIPTFLNLLLLKGRLPLLFYVVAATTGFYFNPAFLYASWLASPQSRSLAFTNFLVLLQYSAAAAAAGIVWASCGGKGKISAAFATPKEKSVLQLAAAETTLAVFVCLAYFQLCFFLQCLAAEDAREAQPLKAAPPAAAAAAAAAQEEGLPVAAGGAAVGRKCSALLLYRAVVMLLLLLLFAALHPPPPAGLNPAVAYTAAWLSSADEFVSPDASAAPAAAAPFWRDAGAWLNFFLLFSFAPYLGSQIAAILWCRFLNPAAAWRCRGGRGFCQEEGKRPRWRLADGWLPPLHLNNPQGDWLRL